MRIKFWHFYKFLCYLPWLAKEIFSAALDVSKLVWGNSTTSPALVRLENKLSKNNIGSVIYANSITLTPGTITVDIDGNHLLVHALTAEGAADLESGRMQSKVMYIFSNQRDI